MNRLRMKNKQRKQNLQSVEMTALEIDQDLPTALPSPSAGITVKRFRGGILIEQKDTVLTTDK